MRCWGNGIPHVFHLDDQNQVFYVYEMLGNDPHTFHLDDQNKSSTSHTMVSQHSLGHGQPDDPHTFHLDGQTGLLRV